MRSRLMFVVLLATLTGATIVGCERRVVGETYEGQLAGGRSLQVTAESPPRGATGTGAPEALPASTRGWSVRENDPSIRAQLTASGARIPLRDAPHARVVAPLRAIAAPAPAPEPAPAPPAQP